MDPAHRYKIFAPADDDKYIEMCAQEWYQQTYAEFIKDPETQFLLPLIFYIDYLHRVGFVSSCIFALFGGSSIGNKM